MQNQELLAMIEATTGKSPERETLFLELTKELKSHAAAEEQALWATVLRNPDTTEDARHEGCATSPMAASSVG